MEARGESSSEYVLKLARGHALYELDQPQVDEPRVPVGARELKAYVGPFPPSGTHDYEFTLYALKTDMLDLPEKVSLETFTKAVEQSSLATAKLVGKFARNRVR